MAELRGNETSLFPNGNVKICTFVKLDTTTEGYCLQAGSGDRPFGIAGPETHVMSINIAGSNLDDGYAGVAGGPAIKIYGVGSTMVPLRVVDSSVNIGDILKPDSSGYGTVTTTSTDKVGAIARQSSTTANTIINVDVVRFDI